MKTLKELMMMRNQASQDLNNKNYSFKTRAIAEQYKEEITKKIIQTLKGETIWFF